jgi:hypothetical protein
MYLKIYVYTYYGGFVGKVKVTISLDENKWTKFRIECLKNKKSASEVIEEMIGSHTKNKV